MEGSKENQRIAVVGGGLVGSLNAIYLARQGYRVCLYESRPDIRKEERVSGRSINLALSERGRNALRKIGLEDEACHVSYSAKTV
jgi:kynurenine 3-monooxygenase